MKDFVFLVELIDILGVENVKAILCKDEKEMSNLVNNYDKAKYQLGNIHNLGLIEGLKETDITPFLKKEEKLELGNKPEVITEEKTNA